MNSPGINAGVIDVHWEGALAQFVNQLFMMDRVVKIIFPVFSGKQYFAEK